MSVQFPASLYQPLTTPLHAYCIETYTCILHHREAYKYRTTSYTLTHAFLIANRFYYATIAPKFQVDVPSLRNFTPTQKSSKQVYATWPAWLVTILSADRVSIDYPVDLDTLLLSMS